MDDKYDVTIMFRVPRSVVEQHTPEKWRELFIANETLTPEWFEENADPDSPFSYDDVAKILAWDYIGSGGWVSGYEEMETDVEKTWVEGSLSHEEYEKYLDSICGATIVGGSKHDPYSADCEEPKGHYPETKHEALNPLGPGKIRWNGGGSAGGDALPYRDVEYVS